MSKNPYKSRFSGLYDDEKKEKEKKSDSFTVDSDDTGLTEMPGITKLLNRKSLGLSKLLNKQEAPVEAFNEGKNAVQEGESAPSTPSLQDLAAAALPAPAKKPPAAPATPVSEAPTQSKETSQGAPAAPAAQQGGLHEIDLSGNTPSALSLEFEKPASAPAPKTERQEPAAAELPPLPTDDAAPAALELGSPKSELSPQAPQATQGTAPTIELSVSAPAPGAAQGFTLESSPSPPPAAAEQASPPAIEMSALPPLAAPPVAHPAQPTPPVPPPAAAVTPPAPPTAARVQPTARPAQRRSAATLILWDPHLLKTGQDPLGRGLALLLEKGATSALFLSILPPAPGAATPQFAASAAVAPKGKLNVWRGLKWDPALVPEVWNAFLKSGVMEFSPPGHATNQKSSRNVIRSAFGAEADEWVLLIRCGPGNQLRGALAIVSTQSLLTQLGEALPLIGAPLSKSSAA